MTPCQHSKTNPQTTQGPSGPKQTFLRSFFQKATLFSIIGIVILFAGCNEKESKPTKHIQELTQGWEFRQVGETQWRSASVPGVVHTDLMAHGLIRDPFYRDNETGVQWVGEKEWEYRTTIEIGKGIMAKQHIRLLFHGLDTYAHVFIDNREVLEADNMFRDWEINLKPHIKEGVNTLLIRFFPPETQVEEAWRQLGYGLPGGKRVMTRKAAYHYGWDWGPKLVTCGIWRPVELLAWDSVRIEDMHLQQQSLNREAAVLTAEFDILSEVAQEVEISVTCDLVSKEQQRRSNDRMVKRITLQLEAGDNRVSFPIGIEKPKLWWTNGLGKPHLYTVRGQLKIHGQVQDEIFRRIGLRTLEVVVKKDKATDGTVGETFYFKLNGVPLFMKGANIIPLDSFLPRVSDAQYRRMIDQAVDANMNMLRVWGGGIYEKDLFYDLCDEKGILVWQDFMFACAMYPGSDTFIENVRQEAIDNVKRLRRHPCIALWCGNNEIDEGWHNWGWQDAFTQDQRARIGEDYEKLFHGVLPQVVAQYDSGRFYWPSSPKFGRGNTRSLAEGDSHYWGVWHDAEPFSVFQEKTGRFMSEYGFQSYPSLDTIDTFTAAADRAGDSKVMNAHQKHPRGNELIETYIARHYHMPKDLPQFVYLSQVLQAEGIKLAIEAHRRARPFCMGTLYWQLNDCWPVVSWSSIDYDGNWKALHYFVKKAYQPVILSTVEEEGKLRVYLVSDRLEPMPGTLKLELIDLQGGNVWQKDLPVTARANQSHVVFEETTASLIGKKDKANLLWVAQFLPKEGDQSPVINHYYFVPPKSLNLKPGKIVVRWDYREPHQEGKPTVLSLRLSAGRLAKNVYLRVLGIDGFFSDNFFDLVPGRIHKIYFTTTGPVEAFEQKLEIRSVRGIETVEPFFTDSHIESQ